MLLALATLLAFARAFGEVARKLGLPAVLGEIIAGLVLGRTVLGNVFPEFHGFLFPAEGPNAIALHGMTIFSVILFLLVAGLEVDVSTLIRLRRSAAIIGVTSICLPFAVGASLGWFTPALMGGSPGADPLVFSLFLGVALSIAALPVIAKTLMDLNLYRTDVGMMVIATAIFLDLVGWVIFAVVLGLMGHGAGATTATAIVATAVLAVAFAAFMFTIGRWAIDKALPWVHAHSAWPGGILAFAVVVALFSAAATEAIGIHAIFGAFLAGVALGDSPHLRERTRRTIEQFVGSIFAPLFFASIGLRVDFVQHFDLVLVMIVLAVACLSQTVGGTLGATLAGFPRRHALVIGLALNARGAMEIVLALLALQYGVISERLFVALVVMALVTSIIAGPAIQRVLGRRRSIRFKDCLSARSFVPDLKADTPAEAIGELVAAIASTLKAEERFDPEVVTAAVLEREAAMSTALDHSIAVPNARLEGITVSHVAVGVVRAGIDFNARDGQPTRLIFLVLTPRQEVELQLELLADIARTFHDRTLAQAAIRCPTFTEFVALLNTGAPPDPGTSVRRTVDR